MASVLGLQPVETLSKITREGSLLYVPEGLVLPPYCVFCGAETAKCSKQKFTRMPEGGHLWLLILGIVVFRQFTLEVPLCGGHRWRRIASSAAAMMLLLIMLPIGVAVGLELGFYAGLIAGVLTLVAAGIVGVRAQQLRLKCVIDDYEFVFSGASEEFLARIGLRQAS